ncbi:MAG: acyl-CoA desaturase [Bacteroidota bacterium]
MAVLIFFALHWYLSLFSQTFFLHRYAAHRMFTMSKFWEKFFHIFTWITQGSSYISPHAYGVLHRLHHAHADTEHDPHSPKYSTNAMTLMMKTKRIYSDIYYNKADVDPKHLRELPEWLSFSAFAEANAVRVAWGMIYIAFYYFFATHWAMWLLLPIHFLMGPFHGVVINWFAHKYGYINFKVFDTSKNFLPFDFLMMGESYHNNHHSLQNRANFGVRWFEIDPTYLVIMALDKLRIIRLRPHAEASVRL